MSRLIFGCGYLGLRVAQQWVVGGDKVFAVTRSARRADQLRATGVEPLVADVTDRSTLVNLPPAETVLFAVGFDRKADQSIHDVFQSGLKNVLAALPEQVQRLIYISSTGVYSQQDGQWVDEQSPCEPLREGGKACLAAETALRQHPLGSRANVLRLAGIYGPGRIPFRDRIAAGQPIAVPRDGYLNLIHVEDAAAAVLAIEQHAPAGRLYLISDGQPVVRAEYYHEVARLLGAPAPVFTEPSELSPATQRASSNKRICNRRLLQEIPLELKYPSYREGLASILCG